MPFSGFLNTQVKAFGLPGLENLGVAQLGNSALIMLVIHQLGLQKQVQGILKDMHCPQICDVYSPRIALLFTCLQGGQRILLPPECIQPYVNFSKAILNI